MPPWSSNGMRVNRVVSTTSLWCCAVLYSISLPAQTLLTPRPAPKTLSSEQLNSRPGSLLHSADPGILSADAAFNFTTLTESRSVLLSWSIQPGYYLYQSQFNFSDSEGRRFSVELPPATKIVDEFLGESMVYFDSVQLRLPLVGKDGKFPATYSFTVQFQGCAKDRYCYPPQTKVITAMVP